MSLPIVESHVADITNVDAASISFSLPASIPSGAGVICWISAWDDSNTGLQEDDVAWTRLDYAADLSNQAELLIIGRVTQTADEGGTTVTVGTDGATATAIVHVAVITNWWGDFTDGFVTTPYVYKASDGGGTTEWASPSLTIAWPETDQHLVWVWGAAGRQDYTWSATPAGYTMLTDNLSSVAESNRGVNLATGYKELTGTSESPGDFDLGNAFLSRYAGTFAIRGVSTGPSLTVTPADLPLTPGGTISGTYSNYATIPTTLTVSDGTNTITIASPTINDNGDGTGDFSGTMPALPTSGTANLILFGDVDVELT